MVYNLIKSDEVEKNLRKGEEKVHYLNLNGNIVQKSQKGDKILHILIEGEEVAVQSLFLAI